MVAPASGGLAEERRGIARTWRRCSLDRVNEADHRLAAKPMAVSLMPCHMSMPTAAACVVVLRASAPFENARLPETRRWLLDVSERTERAVKANEWISLSRRRPNVSGFVRGGSCCLRTAAD